MRQPLVMGNWKLNGTKASVEALVKALIEPAAKAESVEVAVCPPVIFLGLVEKLAEGSRIQYGAQTPTCILLVPSPAKTLRSC